MGRCFGKCFCFLLIFLYEFAIPASAQTPSFKADSLEHVLHITDDHREQVRILLQLSKITVDKAPQTALDYAIRAKTIAGSMQGKGEQIKVLLQMASVHRAMQEYEFAVENLHKATALQTTTNQQAGLADLYNRIGLLYKDQGNFENAKTAFQEACNAAQTSGSKKQKALALGHAAGIYQVEEKPIEALENYIKAIKTYPNAETDTAFAPFYRGLGKIYQKQGNVKQGLIYYEKAILLYEQAKNVKKRVETHFDAGEIHFILQNYHQALAYFQRCHDGAQSIGYLRFIISSSNKISLTYVQLKDYKNAYEYLSYFAAVKNSKAMDEMEARREAEANRLRLIQLQQEKEMSDALVEKGNAMNWLLISGLGIITIGLIYVLQQIKQKNLINMALQKAKENAERSEEEKEKFLAYTSHEIRTPLNAVLGMTEMLLKTRLTTDQARYLHTIRSSSDNILVIVNDILDLTKIDSGKIEFESIDFMITELIEEVVYMLQPQAHSKELKISLIFGQKLPWVIKGDPLRLTQILLNLVNNAIKFTEAGEVQVGVHVLHQDQEKVKLEIAVSDTGIGIKQEKLNSVFNRFEQEDKDTTRKYGGAGLGLSITKQLVELQGGNISVRSKEGKGSIFSVHLEYLLGDRKDYTTIQVPHIPKPVGYIASMRILLVDDNLLNRMILSDLLKDWSAQLTIDMAEDGEQALAKLHANDYDVVLMDIQMPVKNGYQTSEQIRKNFPEPKCEVPIVAMTAHALSEIADKCKAAGMDDYVSKPIDLCNLLGKFSKLIEVKVVKGRESVSFKTFDPKHLQEMTRSDSGKMVRYIDIFLKNLDVDLEALRKAYETEDWDALIKRAHKMKGNCAYMGIDALVQLFNEIQTYHKREVEYKNIRPAMEQIEQWCRKSATELREYRSGLEKTLTN